MKISNPTNVKQAAKLLIQGKLCAFPTETVYGLGAIASDSEAILSIYQTKNRPAFNPLIIHCADYEMATELVKFSPLAKKLTQFWPGALTLVLPKNPTANISDIVSAGLDTLAVRVPAHKIAQQLIKTVGEPLAAPSANPSGNLSPTNAQMVKSGFDNKVPVLDGGACEAGLESTIIAIIGEEITQLRAGAIAKKDIEKAIGQSIKTASSESKISAPGMLKSHYAPKANLRLNVSNPNPDEAYLAFGIEPKNITIIKNLSPSSDLKQAAKNLFSFLNILDEAGAKNIAIAPIPNQGLGEAINDRLKRAATPKS